jgi:hypothetical protein
MNQPFGNHHHVALLADDQVGVGRVAGAQHRLGARVELDLDLEQLGVVLLDRLRRDAGQPPGDDGIRQGADLQAGLQPHLQLADVDLVDRPLEQQIMHVGQGGHLRPFLVAGQRHHRVPRVDVALQDDAAGRGPDRRLEVVAAAVDAPLADQRQVVPGPLHLDARQLVRFALRIDILAGDDPLLRQLVDPLPVRFGAAERRLARLEGALGGDQLGRGRIGLDVEQLVAPLHLVADVDDGAGDDAGNLRFDVEFYPRLDLADRDRFFGQVAAGHVDHRQTGIIRRPGVEPRVPADRRPAQHDHHDEQLQHPCHRPLSLPRIGMNHSGMQRPP